MTELQELINKYADNMKEHMKYHLAQFLTEAYPIMQEQVEEEIKKKNEF